jgi:hypothetical protein
MHPGIAWLGGSGGYLGKIEKKKASEPNVVLHSRQPGRGRIKGLRPTLSGAGQRGPCILKQYGMNVAMAGTIF